MAFSPQENIPIPSTGDVVSNFENMDAFFQNVDWSQLDTSIASSALLEDKFVCQKDLGCNVYLRAQVYRNDVKIHIRKFLLSKDSDFTPTLDGVCMDLNTFYRLFLKIHSFNLEYTHASFVANNRLLVLNENGKCVIQDMKSFKHIVLDFHQLQALKIEIREFVNTLLNFLFTEYLSTLISMSVPASVNCAEDNFTLCSKVIACVENELAFNILKKEFYCEGCAENRCSQLHHDCMTMRDLNKFEIIGQFSLMCVNFDSIVKSFKQQTSLISPDFMSEFKLDTLVDVLFKTPQDL